MRNAWGLVVVALLVVGCAKPPPPLTGAERALPHVVRVAPAPPAVTVDADTVVRVPAGHATSGAGAIGLLIGQAIVVAMQAPAARQRAEHRANLQGSLGDTSPAAAAFAESFDAALERSLGGVPGFGFTRQVADAAVPSEAAQITIGRNLALSADARQLIGRAFVGQLAPGRRVLDSRRFFLVFSEPLDAFGDAHATMLWQEEQGRRLRAGAEAVAQTLAALIAAELFAPGPPDTDALPRVTLATPGVTLNAGAEPDTAAHPRMPPTIRPYLLRRDADRAVLLLWQEPNEWVWISVPASALPAPAS